MNPDPPGALARLAGFSELTFDLVSHPRPVPPRADREEVVVDGKAVSIPRDAGMPRIIDPARNLLATPVAFIEIVVAGAKKHRPNPGEQREVLANNHDLRRKIHEGSDIQ